MRVPFEHMTRQEIRRMSNGMLKLYRRTAADRLELSQDPALKAWWADELAMFDEEAERRKEEE